MSPEPVASVGLSNSYQPLANALADRYRIERQLGQGGMATVYLAHDIKHDRKVAVKVLKPELAAVLGAERFVVEIKTTASLQHPHILPLFDSGSADGFLYYVMPYIEGETLRSKLNRETQLGIDEALRITIQVADALDYAHRHGVIHRDIKPENILLHDGRPMVADFGIALAVSAAAGGRMTETGLSLGTPHYMSPEQATAEKDITARSDVYSLASVLYEMLAGVPPHSGGSAQQIIMRIITDTPRPVTDLRKSVSANVADALTKALEKLPADRFTSAAAFAAALGNRQFSAATQAARPIAGTRSWLSDVRSRIALGSIGVLLVVAVLARGLPTGRRDAADQPPMVVRLAIAPDTILGNRSNGNRPTRTAIAIAPNGSAIAYVSRRGGTRQLFLRPLAGESATPIAGTDGAESPFFSPNSQHLGFWSGGRLMRVPLAGGSATQIAAVDRIIGASWSDDDRIAVGTEFAGIIVLSANGVAPPDTILGPGATLPHFLPGGAALLFSQATVALGLVQKRIEAFTFSTGARKILVEDGADARYVPTGHLTFGRAGTLLAVPFDAARLSVAGSPVVMLDDVMQSFNGESASDVTGAVQAAFSPLGHLVYLTGGLTPDRQRQLTWLDRRGNATPIAAAGTRPFFAQRLSPDERRIVVTTMGKVAGLHVVDLARGNLQTLDVRDFQLWPLWLPDGKRVVHRAYVRDTVSLVLSLADGSRPPALMADKIVPGEPAFWSPDGTTLYVMSPLGGDDRLRAVSLSDGSITPVGELRGIEFPVLSPNGKWIAYSALEAGSSQEQVFVQPWPAADRKWRVSVDGGSAPMWTRDGAELVFISRQPADSIGVVANRMMSVQVNAGADFSWQPPRELFTAVFANSTPLRAYDVTRDGSRFLVAVGSRVNAPAGEPRMIVNWFAQLRRLSAPQARR
jgi:eukaryotic-like serine/threonine-protein kinase